MKIEEIKGATVFVIDDNPNNLSVVVDHLTQFGMTVVPLKSGEAALALVEKRQADIILLDVRMPGGIDGFETCRLLKDNPVSRDIPVIFISAASETIDKVTGFDLGGVDYITKPFDIEELLSRLYVHLTIHRLRRDLEEANKTLEEKVEQRTKELREANKQLKQENSDRKQAEAETRQLRKYLSNIIDSMPSVLVGVDIEGNITQWNKTAEKSTGISLDAALGKKLIDVIPDMKAEVKTIIDSIRSKKTRQERKMPRTSGDNTYYEDVTIYPLITNGVEGAVIRIDNVTDRVRMEEILIQSEKMMSVGGLAAGMAHEINNPIAGMLQTAKVMFNRLGGDLNIPSNIRDAEAAGTSIEAIKNYMESRGILRMIDTITESGRRVADIVNNMLSFARKSEIQAAPEDLSKLIDKTIELAATDYNLKKNYDFKMIKISTEYNRDLPPVPCECAKIQQVLLNVLRNGSQAMQDSKTVDPQFTVRTYFDEDREMACLEIEDNGPGMEEDVRKRVFDPFFTTKPTGAGTGLGLSVSYFIITEDHGGEMSVESQPGKGTKFIINLPLKRSKSATNLIRET